MLEAGADPVKGARRTEKMANEPAPCFNQRHSDEWAWPAECLKQELTPLKEHVTNTVIIPQSYTIWNRETYSDSVITLAA